MIMAFSSLTNKTMIMAFWILRVNDLEVYERYQN